jgi:hypothetical protein
MLQHLELVNFFLPESADGGWLRQWLTATPQLQTVHIDAPADEIMPEYPVHVPVVSPQLVEVELRLCIENSVGYLATVTIPSETLSLRIGAFDHWSGEPYLQYSPIPVKVAYDYASRFWHSQHIVPRLSLIIEPTSTHGNDDLSCRITYEDEGLDLDISEFRLQALEPFLPYISRCTFAVHSLAKVPWSEIDALGSLELLRMFVRGELPPINSEMVQIRVRDMLSRGYIIQQIELTYRGGMIEWILSSANAQVAVSAHVAR